MPKLPGVKHRIVYHGTGYCEPHQSPLVNETYFLANPRCCTFPANPVKATGAVAREINGRRYPKGMRAIINTLVEEFQELPLDDQEYVAEIICKQLLEFKREELADRVAEARVNYKMGKCKSGAFDELMEDLDA